MQPNKTAQQMKTGNYIALMAIITILVLLVGGLAVKTFGSAFLANQKVINKKSAANKVLEANVAAVNGIVDEYDDLGANAQTITNIMPTDTDIPGLANAVEAMASTSGAALKDVTNSALVGTSPAGTEGPQPVPVTVSANLAYANLFKFVTAIESSARPIHISSVSLTGTNANLNVEVGATTYFQNAKKFEVKTEAVK